MAETEITIPKIVGYRTLAEVPGTARGGAVKKAMDMVIKGLVPNNFYKVTQFSEPLAPILKMDEKKLRYKISIDLKGRKEWKKDENKAATFFFAAAKPK